MQANVPARDRHQRCPHQLPELPPVARRRVLPPGTIPADPEFRPEKEAITWGV